MPVVRARKKCSECRKKKIRCTPRNRDFDTTGQKCDSCKSHSLPCGPNLKKADDPLACQKDNDGAEKQPLVKEAPEEIVRDATSNLEKLDWLLKALQHASQLLPVSCNLQTREQRIDHNDIPKPYVVMMISKARSLFVAICRKAQQLHKDSMNKDASIIVLKLVIALQGHPELCDDTIMGMMANFFKDTGDTQRRADEFLQELFDNNLMVYGARKVVIPAIPLAQRAALCCSAKVSKLVAESSDSMEHPAPGLFNLEAIHLAAVLGREETLNHFLRKGAPVEDKDLQNHTALFIAAFKGHKSCCKTLLEWGANPNEKDAHGTSILEVAVTRGHFEVVKLLVEAKADLNPTRPCPCTPSLLEAAIKSPKSALEIVMYLLKKGAIVDKTAIDLATENGLDFLVQKMLQFQQIQQQDLAIFRPDLDP